MKQLEFHNVFKEQEQESVWILGEKKYTFYFSNVLGIKKSWSNELQPQADGEK